MTRSETRIVLVANIKKIPNAGYAKHMSSLDYTKRVVNGMISNALRKLNYEVVEYGDIKSFIKNVEIHKNDLVFPYHFGVASKVRQSLVQTICEIYNIKFLGADAYSQTIANDKVLSKEICRYSGILTTNFKTMFDINFPPDLTSLNLPLIVKPQFEGDSIGISDKNVFYSKDNIIQFAKELLLDLNQPTIIEEYIDGRELSVCIIGYKSFVKKIGVVENIKGNSRVKSYNAKKFKISKKKVIDINEVLNNETMNKIINLFNSMDKVEYMRLDFIYKNDNWYNIELTTDPDLSPFSPLYIAFKNEFTYKEFINLLISNCKERYNYIKS